MNVSRTPNLLTLLCLSRDHERLHRAAELALELAGYVSLEAAEGFAGGLSLGGTPLAGLGEGERQAGYLALADNALAAALAGS